MTRMEVDNDSKGSQQAIMNPIETTVGHDENQIVGYCGGNQKIDNGIGIREKMGIDAAVV